MAPLMALVALGLAVGAATVQASELLARQANAEAALHELVDMANRDPEAFVKDVIHPSPWRAVMKPFQGVPETVGDGTTLPTVTAHGMGDSCFEPGFGSITRAIGQRAGSYATCIPTGSNIITDTIYGYFMNMDKSVEVFASKIRADKRLANGFNAIGFSQGNSLIRGYIQKYNDPPVNSWISVHGTGAGVAGLPGCNPEAKIVGVLCRFVANFLADFAYLPLFQDILFQADFYRDPTKLSGTMYKSHSQLGAWNNEGNRVNSTFKVNFAKTKKFVMVKALQDTMVYPNEAEHWGQFEDGSYSAVQQMKDMSYYKSDAFGLRTADEQKKIVYETTPGDHLDVSDEQILKWVDQYFVGQTAVVV